MDVVEFQSRGATNDSENRIVSSFDLLSLHFRRLGP